METTKVQKVIKRNGEEVTFDVNKNWFELKILIPRGGTL